MVSNIENSENLMLLNENEPRKNTVLIVDDQPVSSTALMNILKNKYTVYVVDNGQDAIKKAEELLPDVILLDILMPDLDGYEVIDELKKSDRTKDIPVVFITGLRETDYEKRGLSLGAIDYITKPFVPEIVEIKIKNQMRLVNQMRLIKELSMTDQLTGLPNRRSFDTCFKSEWDRALREHEPISLLVFDIDKFKVYNDTFGHIQGDVALKTFADVLRATLKRPGDFIARWGGEEFIALLPRTDSQGAIFIAEQVRKNIFKTDIFTSDGKEAKITVSVGVNTRNSGDSLISHEFFMRADEALYVAKKKGRNKVYSFNMSTTDEDSAEENQDNSLLANDTNIKNPKHSVLIVDDEASNCLALTRILKAEYNVYVEKNGRNALRVAETRLPDVILLDVVMFDIDGYEVLTSLKNSNKTKDIPVIFITGLREADEEERGLALGAADYITKPFCASIVKLRVENQIKISEFQEAQYNIMKYKLASDAMHIALWDTKIVVSDPINASNIFTWSDELRRMLGFTDENDFPNTLKSLSERIHPDDKARVLNTFAKHIVDRTGKTPFNLEHRMKMKTGEYRHFHTFGETMRDKNGTPVRVAGAVMDITEKVCISESLNDTMEDLILSLETATAASKAKSDFLSNMSHEMRTPMNAIIGMTAIAKKEDDFEKVKLSLNKIGEASSHLLGVINDVLDMAKIEADKLELFDVEFNFEQMLQKILSVIQFSVDKKRQIFSFNIDSNLPHFIVGDDQRLSQVITNLLSNAVKFTHEYGTINLTASLNSKNTDIKSGETFELRVEVTDSGIGIPHEKQESLFELFEQAENGTCREYGGTGLGLAISKRIVELMDGEIHVESAPNEGAKFVFTAKVKCGNKNAQSMLLSSVDWSNVRVLAVDDDMKILKQLSKIFSDLNIKCDVAFDGFEACQCISDNGAYDIYLIDWFMPGMDGIELTRHIKSLPDDKSTVVMITLGDWKRIKDDALSAGVDKHMIKPLLSTMIIDCLNECCEPDSTDMNYAVDGLCGGIDEFSGKRMLLVEDVEINREIIIALLENTGIDIDCAENGQEALDKVTESFATNASYDIVFMDIQMPTMEGLEATRRIRKLQEESASDTPKAERLPIIALTANVFSDDIDACLEAGMNAHLGKPLDIDKVREILRKYLR